MKTDDLYFVTSWDDGHPLDIQLAGLLDKYGFKGTFFTPVHNVEGKDVLSTADLREIAKSFEIGSHTLDHVYLDSVSRDEAIRQVVEGKNRLEEILGKPVPGFCYPGGRYNSGTKKIVADAGFSYARTVSNFHLGVPDDPFILPTSIQFHPHSRNRYFLHMIGRYEWWRRRRLFSVAIKYDDLLDRLKALLDLACYHGGVFHLWGHSWDIDEFAGWGVLDDFLCYASQIVEPQMRIDNLGLYNRFFT